MNLDDVELEALLDVLESDRVERKTTFREEPPKQCRKLFAPLLMIYRRGLVCRC